MFFALNRYFISLTTFVIESIRAKFSILTILPTSVAWRASNGSRFELKSSGDSFSKSFAKSGMYTSPMHPIIANQRSSFLLNIF